MKTAIINTANIKSIEDLRLTRFPKKHDPSLRAWNAADEYLIKHLKEKKLPAETRILILNDQFGALCSALSDFNIDYWSDSYLSNQAIQQNLKQNKIETPVTQVRLFAAPKNNIHHYDYIIIRVPKHNSLLQLQLASLAESISEKTQVIAAGMTKEIHNKQLKLFEQYIGTTRTSLAKKKARLIFSRPEGPKKTSLVSDSFKTSAKSYQIQNPEITAYGYPGVFARQALDQGARVLLNHLPTMSVGQSLVDLGCGNGILGTAMAKLNPGIQVTFCDESWLAIQSAKRTFAANIPSSDDLNRAKFFLTDVLTGVEESNFDLILCNPPFHQQKVQTLSIAKNMFSQAAKKLKTDGELRVVANRHLPYQKLLNQHFSEVKIISKDPKFIVWLATKPHPNKS